MADELASLPGDNIYGRNAQFLRARYHMEYDGESHRSYTYFTSGPMTYVSPGHLIWYGKKDEEIWPV